MPAINQPEHVTHEKVVQNEGGTVVLYQQTNRNRLIKRIYDENGNPIARPISLRRNGRERQAVENLIYRNPDIRLLT